MYSVCAASSGESTIIYRLVKFCCCNCLCKVKLCPIRFYVCFFQAIPLTFSAHSGIIC